MTITIDGEHADRVESVLNDGITFEACLNILHISDLDREVLVAGVETVSAGVGELIRLQNDGDVYVRP